MSKKKNDQRELALKALVKRFEESRGRKTEAYLSQEEYEELLLHYYGQEDYDQTLLVADLAIAQFTFTPEFYKWKALIHKIGMEEDLAMATLEKLNIYAPNDPEVLTLRLEVLTHFQHVEPARAVLEQLLATTTDDVKVSSLAFYDAQLFLQEGQFEEAWRAFRWSVRLDPWQEASLDELLNAGELETFRQKTGHFLRTMVDKNPFNDVLWFYLGIYYDDDGDDHAALDAFGNARSLNEDRAAYELEYADKLFDLEFYESALKGYAAYYEHPEAEDSYESFMRIGRSHQLLNQFKPAKEAFVKARELSPHMYDVYQHLGECYVGEENWAMAVYHYGQSVEQQQHTSDCWLGLALCQSALGQSSEAEAAFLKALEMDDHFSDAYVTYALFLVEQGRELDAVEVLKEARQDYQDAALLYGSVAVLLMCNRRKQALNQLNDALSAHYADHDMLLDWNPQLREDSDVAALLALHGREP